MRAETLRVGAIALLLHGCVDAPVSPPDAGRGAVDAEVVDAGAPPLCARVPTSGYGVQIGDRFPPFVLPDCEGTPRAFYDDAFCADDQRFTVVNIAAGWCIPCRIESMELTERITEPYRARGVRVVQVLIQDADFQPPTLETCATWVDEFGLTNLEVIDPQIETQGFLPGNELPVTVIVDREGVIRFIERGSSEGLMTLRATLDALLGE